MWIQVKRGRVGAQLPAEPWALEEWKRPAAEGESDVAATEVQADMDSEASALALEHQDSDPDFDLEAADGDEAEGSADSRRASLITIKGLRSICANVTGEGNSEGDGEAPVAWGIVVPEGETGIREADGRQVQVEFAAGTSAGPESASGASEVIASTTITYEPVATAPAEAEDTICAPQLSRTSESSCSSNSSTTTSSSSSSSTSLTTASTSTPSLSHSHTSDSSESEFESSESGSSVPSTQPSIDDLTAAARHAAAISVYGDPTVGLNLDYDYLRAVSRLGRTPSPHLHLSPVSPKAAHHDFGSIEESGSGDQLQDDAESEGSDLSGAQTAGYHSGESTPPHELAIEREYGYGFGYGNANGNGLGLGEIGPLLHARSASNTSLWTFNMVESPLSPRSPRSLRSPQSPREPLSRASTISSSEGSEDGEGEADGGEGEGDFYSMVSSSSHESFYTTAGTSRAVSYAEAVIHDDGSSETGDDVGDEEGEQGDTTMRLSLLQAGLKQESFLDLSEASSVYQTAEEGVDAGEGGSSGQHRYGASGSYANGNGNGSARYAGNGNGNGNGSSNVGWPSSRGMRSGSGRDDDDDGRDRRPRGNGNGNTGPPSKVYVETSDSESEDVEIDDPIADA